MSNWFDIVLCNSVKAFVLLSLFALAILSIPSKHHPRSLSSVVERVLVYLRETRLFIINVLLPVGIQSLHALKATLSTSLPNREESAFEEEFKYLIVTSSLLNDMPSLSQKFAASSSSSPVPPSTLQKRPNIPAFLIPTVTVTSLLCIASFLKSFAPLTNIVIVTASCSAALYAFHHQKRRARIRQIYFTTLHLVRQLVALCGHNDARLAVLLDKLHWLDLISQGYTLAPAPAYITLSEPSRRSMEIRRLLAHEFRTQSQKYSTFTDCMDALSHQDNLIRFRTLYNVERVPTYAADFESVKVSIEKLENMATIVHWKRRECVIHLLALDVMTADHDSTRSDYEQQWDSAIRIMRELVSECQRFAELLDRQLEHELVPEYNDGGTEHPDQRTQALVRRYTALEKQMQQIRGKMLLCRQDTVLINPNPGSVASSNYAFDRISERFSSIEQDLSHLTMQWDEIKSTFESLRQQDNDEQEHTNAALSNNTMLPSPPLSPKKVKEQNMRLATLESRRAVVRKAAAVAYFLENRRTQKQRNHQQLLESLSQKRSSMSFPPN